LRKNHASRLIEAKLQGFRLDMHFTCWTSWYWVHRLRSQFILLSLSVIPAVTSDVHFVFLAFKSMEAVY
jgi:hypothetical protein